MKPLPQFLTSILCCAIACGHVLAWVHMGSCGGNCNLQVSAVEGPSNSCCSHCCHPPSVELTDVGHSGLQSAVVVTLTASTIAKAVRSANRSKAPAVRLGSSSLGRAWVRLVVPLNCQSNKCLPWHFFQLPILAGRLLWPRTSCCFWVALQDGVLPFARDQQA